MKSIEEQEFEFTVWSLTNRDVASIDSFLHGAENSEIWAGPIGQNNLAHLLELREKALHAYKSDDMPLMEANIEALHAWCTSIGYRHGAHPKAVNHSKFISRQVMKAKLPRSHIKIDGANFSIGHEVKKLASNRDELGHVLPAKDLWNTLLSTLEALHANPKETTKNKNPVSVEYDVDDDGNRKQYKFTSFKSTISRFNKKS